MMCCNVFPLPCLSAKGKSHRVDRELLSAPLEPLLLGLGGRGPLNSGPCFVRAVVGNSASHFSGHDFREHQ
jgi:hypothetical protein